MKIKIETFTVHKRFALTISRGTTAQSTNVLVKVEAEGITGWGESSPFSAGGTPQTTPEIVAALQKVAPQLERFSPLDRQEIEGFLMTLTKEGKFPSAAQAGLDTALQDWLGRKVGLPLWQLWGLDRSRIVPTSLTIGISSPEAARTRVRHWFNLDSDSRETEAVPATQGCAIKVKLGSPAGIEADRAMFLAVQEEAPRGSGFSIDANGGWTLEDAVTMSHWLSSRGVKYLEQPLPVAAQEELLHLYRESPLPIFVDESCFTRADIIPLADRVHGINIKLMKCGGLTEAMRMIHTANACGLQVMFGCYSDSVVANTALSHLSPLADYLDLDSHLNLIDDPFTGAIVQEGRLLPNDLPGLGVQRRAYNS
ncbi:dipeptide epimerase [Laspinema olomoucense]|uniref:dipeptide epimerase n=1 Tax=Laspinema olomoucense TaxID=3231600 RepID=UPI0021BB1913|nr:dipeptide epimerase [Laspinema sp. D3c]MCT7993730.1 dipeptide epimerase [Laspinema sp. D3c]